MVSLTFPIPSRSVIALQYFIYFGTLGVFLPFFNLYLYHLGFSGSQIGTLSGARSLTLVVFPLLWGALADRWAARRLLYQLCTIASALLWGLFLITERFLPMLAITVAYGAFFAPVIAFLEAFTMECLGERKREYGRLRAWGSISFIMTVLILGRVLEGGAVALVVPLILAGSLAQALSAVMLPAAKTGGAGPKKTAASGQPGPRGRTAAFLGCGFIMLFSHGAYYGFFSIHLEKLGFGGSFIGMSWALASVAEILVMLNSERIFRRFALERILVFALVVACLRWLLLYCSRSGAPILLAQLLHAATYGLFHMASILFIDRLSPEGGKTSGQALNNAVTYGLGLMAGFLFSGALFERFGAPPLFLASSLAALAGLLPLRLALRGKGWENFGR